MTKRQLIVFVGAYFEKFFDLLRRIILDTVESPDIGIFQIGFVDVFPGGLDRDHVADEVENQRTVAGIIKIDIDKNYSLPMTIGAKLPMCGSPAQIP